MSLKEVEARLYRTWGKNKRAAHVSQYIDGLREMGVTDEEAADPVMADDLHESYMNWMNEINPKLPSPEPYPPPHEYKKSGKSLPITHTKAQSYLDSSKMGALVAPAKDMLHPEANSKSVPKVKVGGLYNNKTPTVPLLRNKPSLLTLLYDQKRKQQPVTNAAKQTPTVSNRQGKALTRQQMGLDPPPQEEEEKESGKKYRPPFHPDEEDNYLKNNHKSRMSIRNSADPWNKNEPIDPDDVEDDKLGKFLKSMLGTKSNALFAPSSMGSDPMSPGTAPAPKPPTTPVTATDTNSPTGGKATKPTPPT